MLYWALLFFVVAIIAGVFGFGGIASASAGIAQVLFVIFLILFVVAMVARALRGRQDAGKRDPVEADDQVARFAQRHEAVPGADDTQPFGTADKRRQLVFALRAHELAACGDAARPIAPAHALPPIWRSCPRAKS